MSNRLSELLNDTSQSTIWVDAWDYCSRLFLDGQPLDWNNRQAVDEFVRKSDALIHSHVFAVPLQRFFEHAVATISGLKDAMGEKSRTGYALKCMLRDEELRRQLQQALKIIGEALSNKPLVLAVPAPRACIEWAYQQAHGRAPEAMSVEHADSASVYLSDFITSLSHCGLAGVVVEEVCADDAALREEQEIYVPLRNVTRHQQWQLGLRLPYAAAAVGDDEVQFDVVIDRGGAAGGWLDEAYWSGTETAGSNALTYGVIPADAQPETVLSQRKALGGY